MCIWTQGTDYILVVKGQGPWAFLHLQYHILHKDPLWLCID